MALSGDMTVVLNADERRLQEGLKRAERAAKNAASSIGAAFMSGTTISSVSYGAQDFLSVLMQGGDRSFSRAIGAVTNNIQMMGAAWGPWGIATTTALALTAQVGTAMYEAASGTEEATKALQEQAKEFERLTNRRQQGLEFGQRLQRLEADGTSKQIKDEIQATRDRRQRITSEIADREKRISELQKIDDAAGGGTVDWMGRPVKTEAGKQIEEQEKAIDRLRDERRRFANREAALERAMPGAEAREKEKKARKDQIDQERRDARERQQDMARIEKEAADAEGRAFADRVRAIEQMEQQTRTPLEAYRARLEEIQIMAGRGDISPELAARGIAQARSLLPQQSTTQEAAMFGSSAAASAIIKAEANASRQAEEFRVQQNILDEIKGQRQALDDIKANTDQWMIVELK